MKTLLFLRELAAGGAERQFVQIANGLAELGHTVTLATQFPGGAFEGAVAPGVQRRSLHDRRPARPGRAFSRFTARRRFRELVSATRPDVVYSALYPTNALAHAALRKNGLPLAWGFRGTVEDMGWSRRLAYQYCRRHSPEVPLAIFNSRAGEEHHRKDGFRFTNTRIVPNGTDLERFRPDSEAGQALRERWNIAPGQRLLGIVGRLAPVKNHELFFRAAAKLVQRFDDVSFVCVGDAEADHQALLEREVESLGLTERVLFAGPQDDMRAVYSGLDALALTSHSEGSPNAVAEAMACETLAVATDVGDTREVVGDPQFVVAPGDAEALVQACTQVLELAPEKRIELGQRARRHIATKLSAEVCARSTADALESLLEGRSD